MESIDIIGVGQAIEGMAQAASDAYIANVEAQAQIRQAELALQEAISSGLIGNTGLVLTTLDRPFFISDHPNEGGGMTRYSISMQTFIGLMVAMDAWNRRESDPEDWSRFKEAYLDTFNYVPYITERYTEESQLTGGSGMPRRSDYPRTSGGAIQFGNAMKLWYLGQQEE